MTGLDTPLTPLRFLRRSVDVYPDKIAIVDGNRRLRYRDVADQAVAQARAIRASGVDAGENVVFLARNTAELVIAHFGVPLSGAILVALNVRLSGAEIGYILQHCSARLVFAEQWVIDQHASVLDDSGAEVIALPDQDQTEGSYTAFLARARDLTGSNPVWAVSDETKTITINYSSGTTGRPRGVMYTHRGAYLAALGLVIHQGFDLDTRYLWTLPLFHCNGWCGAWAVTAVGGTQVCLRDVRGTDIWRLLATERIGHMSGAPTVLSIIVTAPEARPLQQPLLVTTAGAPPSPTLIKAMTALGARVLHVYGLTETYGPYSVCEYQPAWSDLDPDTLAVRLSRQGVGMITADDLRVVETGDAAGPQPGDLRDVPADGATIGELVMRGNIVMKGYYRDDEATRAAFAGGWFHSGDLGVRHPDGYVELVDRSKDLIISGGENISSIEIENALLAHPAVAEAAAIGVRDDQWGERPRAFVVLRDGKTAAEEELIGHVKSRIARFKAPDSVVFVAALPRSATGKVKKTELRALSSGPPAGG